MNSKDVSPAPTDVMFPTVEKFEKVAVENKMDFRNEVDWRELSIGSVYKIESIQTVPSAKFGDATTLQMHTIDGAEIAVLATKLLANELKKKKLPCYLRPCGLVQSKIIIMIYND